MNSRREAEPTRQRKLRLASTYFDFAQYKSLSHQLSYCLRAGGNH
ncbi:MAG: hypothetical protein ACKV1O_07950 [Saprospiraceae bacterium]